VTFVDGVDCYARVLEVSLLLRNEEGRVGALDDPIERDLDVLDVGMGGCDGRRDNCNDRCDSADAVHRSASLCWLKVLPVARRLESRIHERGGNTFAKSGVAAAASLIVPHDR